jgi:hypothetical protein
MPRTLHLDRDRYGNVTEATFEKQVPFYECFDEWTGKKLEVKRFEHSRTIRNYKDLVWAMCQGPCRRKLFDAAWRRALSCEAELSQAKLSDLDDYLEEARSDAGTIEVFIGELVNDPSSKFYIYG